jgi:undecaprenyl-phosphate 4-deoxy-4-formamido-L-arabinose transferase
VHTLSVVIPVYRGETTLESTVTEIVPYSADGVTPGGAQYRVSEILLVHDNGPDNSDETIRALSAKHDLVRAIWLSRNFGQHAATLAGMASSAGDWVVTLDEDGQQDPADVAGMLDAALANRAQVVYGRPLNPPPHGPFRNFSSRVAKAFAAQLSGNHHAADFNSYRLILGSVARSVAAYAGPGVYLDVALGWVAGRYATADVTLRGEQRASGYSFRSLASHLWRLVISSGTRLLRIVTVAGVVLAIIGIVAAVWIIVIKLGFGINSEGWASTVVFMLVGFGAVLFALGIIAEYVGANVNMAMGKPAYVITTDPSNGPLGAKHTE